MSTFDHKRSAPTTEQRAVPTPDQPFIRFIDVLKAVENAADVTHGVRQNMLTAVNRTAALMSPLGLHGPVQLPEIGSKLDKLAPAQLGFKTEGAMAAYKSNLRRALKLAGMMVMPGRHVTPLSAEWQALLDSIPEVVTSTGLRDNAMRIRLSRFAHVASDQGWSPETVGIAHLERFHALLRETCLTSKCTRVVRETAAAWSEARAKVSGWPQNELGNPERQKHGYALAWAEFPDSFRADVEAFVARDDLDADEEEGDRPLTPLRPRTAFRIPARA